MKKEKKIKIVFKEKRKVNSTDIPTQKSSITPEREKQEEVFLEENKEIAAQKVIRDILKNKKLVYLICSIFTLIVIAVIGYSLLIKGEGTDNKIVKNALEEEKTPSLHSIPADYYTKINVLTKNTSLVQLLNEMHIPGPDVQKLGKVGERNSLINLSIGDKIVSGFVTEKSYIPEVIIIEPKSNPATYYYLQLTGSLDIIKENRVVEIVSQNAIGIIDSSLWLTILENNIHYQLIDYLEAALAWSVDFYHLKPGDYFKVIYNEKFIEGKSQGIVNLEAVYFRHDGENIYAFNYGKNGKTKYYDQDGQEMKKSYLKSPLKYGRMSSPYSLDRKHPVTGVNKPHFGTDYAAPTGTPILSVADGVVIKREFKSNNGNYVKIRHDDTYESQYLHMSEFVPTVNVGTRVQQGQVIGYVGATGLATGPHVCFRFWKNGKQVDHRSEKLSGQRQIDGSMLSSYTDYRTEMLNKLNNISWR